MAQKRKNAIVDSKIFCTFAQKIKGVKEPPKIDKQQYLNQPYKTNLRPLNLMTKYQVIPPSLWRG